jgi:exonuclease I
MKVKSRTIAMATEAPKQAQMDRMAMDVAHDGVRIVTKSAKVEPIFFCSKKGEFPQTLGKNSKSKWNIVRAQTVETSPRQTSRIAINVVDKNNDS